MVQARLRDRYSNTISNFEENEVKNKRKKPAPQSNNDSIINSFHEEKWALPWKSSITASREQKECNENMIDFHQFEIRKKWIYSE